MFIETLIVKAGGRSPKNFFRPFGPQFGLKIRGEGAFPGSTTVLAAVSGIELSIITPRLGWCMIYQVNSKSRVTSQGTQQ